MGVWCNESLHGPTRCNSKSWRCSGCPIQRCCFAHRARCATLRGDRCVHDVRLESMVLDRVHRVACATDMVQSQSWEPVPVEAAVKTGKCGWYIVQVLLSAAPAENPQDKVRNTSYKRLPPWPPVVSPLLPTSPRESRFSIAYSHP